MLSIFVIMRTLFNTLLRQIASKVTLIISAVLRLRVKTLSPVNSFGTLINLCAQWVSAFFWKVKRFRLLNCKYANNVSTEWVERWDEQRENGTFPAPIQFCLSFLSMTTVADMNTKSVLLKSFNQQYIMLKFVLILLIENILFL